MPRQQRLHRFLQRRGFQALRQLIHAGQPQRRQVGRARLPRDRASVPIPAPDLRLYPYPDCGNLRAPLLQPGKQGRHHLPYPRGRRAMRGQQQQCRFRLRAPVVMLDTGHGDSVLQAAWQERQDFRFQ
ncbi:hypothetical protein D3C81_1573930 [compost metagenome]